MSEAGVEPVQAGALIAGTVRNQIERAVQTALSIGLGQGEIVQITLLPTSPAIGRALRTFGTGPWLVAALYREGALIVPHGDTVLMAGDRVVLVGQPNILPAVAEFLRIGLPRFPLPYGTRVAVLLAGRPDRAILLEARYVAQSCGIDAVDCFVLGDVAPWQALWELLAPTGPEMIWHVLNDSERAVAVACSAVDVGCLIVAAQPTGWLAALGLSQSFERTALEQIRCPLLLARGSFPYRRVLIAGTALASATTAGHLGLALARQVNAQVAAAMVVPPTIAAGNAALEEQRTALALLRELGQAQRWPVEEVVREGNPIIEITRLAQEFDLLVLGHRPGRRTTFLRALLDPDVGLALALRTQRSTLVVPWRD